MKRYRPTNWIGWVAAFVLTVVVGSLGLTDAVRATTETASEFDSEQAVATANDDNVSQPANPPAAKPAEKQTLKPTIIFAKHAILWEGSEVLTREQLKERLAKLRSTQPVKPSVYQSQGFALKGYSTTSSPQEVDRLMNDQYQSVMDIVGQNQWYMLSFMTRRGSGAVDRIKTQDDLKIDPKRSLKGRVVAHFPLDITFRNFRTTPQTITAAPVKGAQVVILPLGEPAPIILRDGKLRNSNEEVWYETNAEGMFEADPTSLEYDPIHLYGNGKYLTLMLHETGYLVIDGQLAASDATYELLPWKNVTIHRQNLKENEQVAIWMNLEGTHPQLPELIIGWVGKGEQPLTVKLPRGSGRAVYQRKSDDQWGDTQFRHPLEISDDSPMEIELPALP